MKKYCLYIFLGLLILVPFSRKRVLEYSYGVRHNNEREKLDLVQIGDEWEMDRGNGKVTFWRKPEPEIGHFKKVLEFSLIGLKNEKDFYKKEWPNMDYVFSQYKYDEKTLEYYSIRPNNNLGFSNDMGSEPNITQQINITEFLAFTNKEETIDNKE